MNTLVDPNHGARVPETKEEVASGRPDDAATRPGDATLIELALPPSGPGAGNPTIIELAPASGRTLILPDESAAQGLRQALASVSVTPTGTAVAAAASAAASRARRLLARARALTAPRPQDRARLKRLAPFAVGVASLLATAIPLWSRSPPSSTRGAAAIERLRADLPDPGASPAAAAPPAAALVAVPLPVEPAGETGAPEARPADRAHAAAARSLVDHRRRTRGALATRWKGSALVLRTRNGAPVVD